MPCHFLCWNLFFQLAIIESWDRVEEGEINGGVSFVSKVCLFQPLSIPAVSPVSFLHSTNPHVRLFCLLFLHPVFHLSYSLLNY